MYKLEACDQEESRDDVVDFYNCWIVIILSRIGVRAESYITQSGKATVGGGSRLKRIVRLGICFPRKIAHTVEDLIQILPTYYLYLHDCWSRIFNIMAPSFDNLTEDNGTYDSDEEIDFSGALLLAMFKRLRLTSTKT